MAEELTGELPTQPSAPAPTPNPAQPAPASGTGLTPNVAGALCYLLGIITGVVFLLIEKENRYVRFHALQSILVSVALIVANVVFGLIPVLGVVLGVLLSVLSVVLWLVLMIKAYQGEEWEAPIIGKIAHEQLTKVS